MDVSEIIKVASRKRLNVNAEKLNENTSRTAAKILKLRVAQDTAYWDLKEKLQQVESNNKRLQQNMVEVQMQHEAISGQYQDELRLRPEILNKLSSTREICDVLCDSTMRLKDSLSRCESGQAGLSDAFQKLGRAVGGIKRDYEWEKEMHSQKMQILNDKVTETNEHHEKLIQHLTNEKERAQADLRELRNKLDAVQREKEDFLNKMKLENDQIKQDGALKVAKIQEEFQLLLNKQSHELQELKKLIEKKDGELHQASEMIKELRTAVNNQETYAKSLRNEIEKLNEQIVVFEKFGQEADDSRKELAKTITELNAKNDDLKRNLSNMTIHNQELVKLNSEMEMRAAAEKEQLDGQITKLKNTIHDLNQEVKNKEAQSAAQAAEIDSLQASCHKLAADYKSIETAYEDYMRDSELKISELKTLVDEKEKDVASKASTIAQLMCEVGAAGETAAKLEAAVQKIKEELAKEKEAAAEKDRVHKRQLENIQALVVKKESELSKQLTIILDMRNEKDRLQEKIQGLQSTIDNVQKELYNPQPRPPAGPAPELDDNAVAFAPTPRPINANVNKQPQPIKDPAMPSEAYKKVDKENLDNLLFSLFSDTSMDDDSNALDRHAVDRHFAAMARGEPQPSTSLKRRKMPSGGLKEKDDEDISLSQIRKNMKSNEPRFFKDRRLKNKK